MDHLRSCCDIAINRSGNWQTFCVTHPGTSCFIVSFLYIQLFSELFSYLVQLALVVDDNIAATVLTLLYSAVCSADGKQAKKSDTRRGNVEPVFAILTTWVPH